MAEVLRTQTQFKGKIDIKSPDPFEGHSDDAQAFIDRILNYFEAVGNTGASDQSKIAYAFSLMRGSAVNFRDLYYQKATEARRIGEKVYDSWDDFEKDLFKEFPVVDNKTKWLMQLLHYTQGRRNIPDFLTTFQALALRAGLKDAITDSNGKVTDPRNYEQLLAFFLGALNPKLVERLMNQVGMPVTMEGWYERARRLDAYANFGAMASNNNHRSNNHTSNPYGRVDEPMDIDRVTIPQEVRDQRMREGLCLLCGKKGHYAREHKDRDGFQQRRGQGGPRPQQFERRTQEGSRQQQPERQGQGRPYQQQPRARIVDINDDVPLSVAPPIDARSQIKALRLQMSDADWDKVMLDFT